MFPTIKSKVNRSKTETVLKNIISMSVVLSLSMFALPASAAVQWCAVQTNNGKVVKCHSNPKSCERYVKGRFNWACVPMEK